MEEAVRTQVAEALGRVPSGLFIASARDADGQETAFLASWVMQAGFEPPALSVAVGRDRAAREMMEAPGSVFSVSVIAGDERKQLGPYYRGVEPGVDALDDFEIERTPRGLAVVKGCLAWLELETREVTHFGDHCVVVGEVVGARGGRTTEPAVHVRSDGFKY